MRSAFKYLALIAAWGANAIYAQADQEKPLASTVADAIHPAVPVQVGGILGQRLDLWRRTRLWRVVNDPFLLEGFTHPPGTHPWQGEHAGKWLHAASLACSATDDPKMDEALKTVATNLIAAQGDNGYLGTYAPSERYYSKIDAGDPTTWDVWTQRYAIVGLLSYYDVHQDRAALRACERVADLLMQTVGPPSGDVTRFGTRYGLSSAVLLESIVMLYQRTGDDRYFEFARHIVACIERNPNLRIMAAMRAGEDVTASGDGKAYQLMAVLLGYVELYRATGEKEYLDTAVAAWERILADHVNVAGGPWSYQVTKTTNQECFASPKYFHPTNCVETCSTTTWIQLCLSLFDLTGEARYADAAEVAILNQLIGAQSPNGVDWAYHSMLNMPERGYEDEITCCASSGPRALELYARHLICFANERLVVNSYVPSIVPLSEGDRFAGRVLVDGNYPLAPHCTMRFELEKPTEFDVDFRLPARARALEITINGEAQRPEPTAPGFFRIRRTWKPGDTVALKFDFPLRAHFQTASDGVRWLAFSWGPLALAQSVLAQTDHPQNVLLVEKESEDGSLWLQPQPPPQRESLPSDNATEEFDTRPASVAVSANMVAPSWQLQTARRIVLVPYWQAGAERGGVRTMFPTRRPFRSD